MQTAAASFTSPPSASSSFPLLSLLQEEAVGLQRGVLLRREEEAAYEVQQGRQVGSSAVSRLFQGLWAGAPQSHRSAFPSLAAVSSSVSAPAAAATAAATESEQQQLLRQQEQAAALRAAVENYDASFSRDGSSGRERRAAAADVRRRTLLLLQQQQQQEQSSFGASPFGAVAAASLPAGTGPPQQQQAGAAGSAYGVDTYQHTRLQHAYAFVGRSLLNAAQEDLLRAAAADAAADAALWRQNKRSLLRQLRRAAETPVPLVVPPHSSATFASLCGGHFAVPAGAAAVAPAWRPVCQPLLPLTRAELRCVATLLQWQQQQPLEIGNAAAGAARSIPSLSHVLLPLPGAAATACLKATPEEVFCNEPATVFLSSLPSFPPCSFSCLSHRCSNSSTRTAAVAQKGWSPQQQQRYCALVQAALGCCYFLLLQHERQQQQQSPPASAAAELLAAATGAAAEPGAAAAATRASLLRCMTSAAVAALEGARCAQVEQALAALVAPSSLRNRATVGWRGGAAGANRSSDCAWPPWRAAAVWLRLSIAVGERERQQQQQGRYQEQQQRQQQRDAQQQQWGVQQQQWGVQQQQWEEDQERWEEEDQQRQRESFFGADVLLLQRACAAATEREHVEEREAFACWWRALYLIFRTGNLQVLLLLATGNFLQQQSRQTSWAELAAAATAAAAAPAHAQQTQSLRLGDAAAAARTRGGAGAEGAAGAAGAGTAAATASATAAAVEEEILNYPQPPFFTFVARQLLVLLLESSAAPEQRQRILCECRAGETQAAQELQKFYAALPPASSLESSCAAAVKAQLQLLYPPPGRPTDLLPSATAAAAAGRTGTGTAAAAEADDAATDPHLLLLLSLIYPDAWPAVNIARMLPNASQEDFLHYRLLLSLSVSDRSFAPEETLLSLLQQLAEKLRQQGPAFFFPGGSSSSRAGGSVAPVEDAATAAVALQQQQAWGGMQQQQQQLAEEEDNTPEEEEEQVNLVYPCMLAWTGCCLEAVEWLLQQQQRQSSFLRRACLLLLLLLHRCGVFSSPVLLRLQRLSSGSSRRQEWRATASAFSLLSAAAAAADADQDDEGEEEEETTGDAAAEKDRKQKREEEEDQRFLLLRAFQLSFANSSALACLNFLQLFPAAYCRSLAGWVAARHFLPISSSLFLGNLSADGSSIEPGLLAHVLLLPFLVNEEEVAEDAAEQQQQLLQQEGTGAGVNGADKLASGFWCTSRSSSGAGGAGGGEQQFLLLLQNAAAASQQSGAAASPQQQQLRLQPQQQQLLRGIYAAIRNEGERRRALKESFLAAWLLDDYRSCMQLTEETLEAAACAPALHRGQLPNDDFLRQTATFFLSAFELLKRRVADRQRMQQLLEAWQQTRIALSAAAGDYRGALSLYLQAQRSRSSALLWLPGMTQQQQTTNYVFPLRFAALVEVITHVLLKLLGQRIPLEQLISYQELLLLQQVAAALPLTASSHLVEARASLKELLKQYRKFPVTSAAAAPSFCL